MKTYTVKTTNHYIELDDGTEIEVPYEVCQHIDPIMSEDGQSLAFAMLDEYPSDYERFGPETGVYFVQFPLGAKFYQMDVDQFHKDHMETHKIFPVSYFEHGLCKWSLGLAENNWDTVSFAGLIAIPNNFTNQETAAKAYLKEYTNWCNGEVYGICVMSRDADGEWQEETTSWGYYGIKQTEQVMEDILQ